jgi:hypothetical protein
MQHQGQCSHGVTFLCCAAFWTEWFGVCHTRSITTRIRHVELLHWHLFAFASGDYQVHLWQLSDQQTIAIFKHPSLVYSITFSADSKHILSGGRDNFTMISKWTISFLEDILGDRACKARFWLSLLLHNLTIHDADPHHQHSSLL